MSENQRSHWDRPQRIQRRVGFCLFIAALLLASLWMSAHAQGPATWYVRPDGGSPDQCTGRVNAPYPGSGTAQPCAWDHPFRALPPGGSPRISGGDSLIIATGSYTMGYGAPGADNCDAGGAWDCYMPPVPSGPDQANPTRILGAGWDSGCAQPPQLWGTERANYVLNLTGSSNVEVACLEITDHSDCVEYHTMPSLACQRDTPPFGPWAATGLYAQDSANVHLRDLNIHGLAHAGIWAGWLTDWTVDNVRIAGNGWVGWDGDIGDSSSNAGTLTFRHWTVEWNGCGETYPGQQPIGCWGQEAGGYGDGVGTGTTGGHWIIEDSIIRHNTQDGLDLLYARLPTATMEIRRTEASGNAGNQIKTTGPTLVENSIIVGNCGFFEGRPSWNSGDTCRASGDALVLDLRPTNHATVTNSTLTSEGNCVMIASCALNQTCDGSESVRLRNDIFQGAPRFASPDEDTCFAWYNDESGDVLPQNPFDTDYAVITGTGFGNVTPCPGPHNLCDVSPGLVNPSIDTFDAHLLTNSPAIDAGDNTVCPATDYAGNPRPVDGNGDGRADCDIGAYEWRKPTAWVYLPLIIKNP
jgi:hypothetical protein